MLKKLILMAIASGATVAAARWIVRRVEVQDRGTEPRPDVQRWEDEGGMVVPVGAEPPAAH